jgi:hypothetical protein
MPDIIVITPPQDSSITIEQPVGQSVSVVTPPPETVVIADVGSQGPTGPQGPAGPQGPVGPAGTTNHLLLTNIGVNTHVEIDSHIASTANPHATTKSQVGLGNVDNTSDANKPVSGPQQTALDGKLDLAGGVMGGEIVMEGDLDGTGSINLKSQSTSPTTPTSGVRLYASQDEHLSWRGQSGQSASLNSNALSDERTYVLPDANGTFLLNPLTTNGDILYQFSGAPSRLPSGAENQILKIESGLPVWRSPFNPSRRVYVFDDFVGSTAVSALGWSVTNSGAGAANTSSVGGASSVGALGVFQFVTGSTATGRSCNFLGQQTLIFGQGVINYTWRIRLPSVSDAGNTYTAYIGMGDNTAVGDMVDGVYFVYTHTINGGNWTLSTSSNSVRTTANSGVPLVANSWINLGVTVNAAGTSAQFLINGASVGTITTNIPTVAGRETGPLAKIQKSVGATSMLLQLDYFYMDYTPTTPR